MKVKVLSRSGREIVKGLEVSDDALVDDLQQAFYSFNKKYYVARQRFTLTASPNEKRPAVLERGKKLKEYFPGTETSVAVVFKDLGPQVGYKTVFFWEYFGPLVIYALFYFFPAVFYPWAPKGQQSIHHVQTVALCYWSFHYAKRILETFCIHRFSHASMPVFNLFRNCAYYWLFGAYVAYFVNHPLYTPVPVSRAYVGLTFSMICQLANFYCHVILRSLRPGSGKGGYQIPEGFLFDYITCANYFTEICGWIGFNLATQTVAGYLFMLAGGYQMAVWAIAKHKRLRRLFDGKEGRPRYPRRWIMFPPFL